jgi:hypothetical protein
MLDFFKMCDLLEKNKLHEAASDDLFQKIMAMKQKKAQTATEPQQAEPVAGKPQLPPQAVAQNAPKVPVTVEPSASLPRTEPAVASKSPTDNKERSGDTDYLSRIDKTKLDNMAGEAWHSRTTDKASSHLTGGPPSGNDLLQGVSHRFFAHLGLKELPNLDFVLLDYRDGIKKTIIDQGQPKTMIVPKQAPNTPPPFGSMFRVVPVTDNKMGRKPDGTLINPNLLPRTADSPDFDVVLSSKSALYLKKFIQDKISTYKKGEELGQGVSLIAALLRPAAGGNIDKKEESKIFRAAQFEGFITHPKIAGLRMDLTGLAEEFKKLAGPSAGGLDVGGANDVDALKHLIRTAKQNNFDYFELTGDSNNPTVRVKSADEMGKKVGQEDYAGSESFKRGLSKQSQLMNQLRGGSPLIPQTQKEASQWDENDLMTIMEYWQK